jgi:hypothetical protein
VTPGPRWWPLTPTSAAWRRWRRRRPQPRRRGAGGACPDRRPRRPRTCPSPRSLRLVRCRRTTGCRTRSRHGGGHGGPLANPNFLALDLASVHRIDAVAPPSPLADGPAEHRGRAVVREAEHVEPSARCQHLPRRLKLHRRELPLAAPPPPPRKPPRGEHPRPPPPPPCGVVVAFALLL